MAEVDLYIDCDRGLNVTSELDSTPKALPIFAQGDTVLFRVYLLKGFDRTSEYDQIPTDGLTLQMAIGDLDSGDLYASNYTWDEQEGLYFEGELPMNTEELETALTGETVINATLEVKYLRDGLPTTILQETVRVRKALINPNSVMPVATPTPLSAEAAEAMFVRLTESRPIYLEGANGSLIKLWNDDSSGTANFKADNED